MSTTSFDPAKSRLPVILLAAGQSGRMRGADKLLADVNGTALLRRQARMARAVTTGAVYVTLPARPHPRYAMLEGIDVIALPVPEAHAGMSVSLRAGLAALPADAPAAMILLADLPDLCAEDLRAVLTAVASGGDTVLWRGATPEGKPGHPLVVDRSLFAPLMALEGDTGGREVLAAVTDRTKLIRFRDARARNDLDTPEDWAVWRAKGR